MDALIASYGYALVPAATFLESIGLPLPSAVVLLYVGALASSSSMSVPLLLLLGAAGALLADTAWFVVGRRRGRSLVSLYCTITLGSHSCTTRTERFFRRFGLRTLLVSNFVPGLSTFAAPMAGLSGASFSRFFLYDGLGTLFFTGTLLLVGQGVGATGVDRIARELGRAGPYFTWSFIFVIGALIGFRLLRRLLRGPARLTIDVRHLANARGAARLEAAACNEPPSCA